MQKALDEWDTAMMELDEGIRGIQSGDDLAEDHLLSEARKDVESIIGRTFPSDLQKSHKARLMKEVVAFFE